MGREITEAEHWKRKVLNLAAEMLLAGSPEEREETIRIWGNAIANKARDREDAQALLLAIQDDIVARLMGPRTPEEFFQAYPEESPEEQPSTRALGAGPTSTGGGEA